MVKQIVVFIFWLLAIKLSAQVTEFAPVGANWWITERQAFGPPDAYYLFESEKDTIVDSITLKEINKYRIQNISIDSSIVVETFYYYQDSLKIYLYDMTTHIAEPYFDFGAAVGDTISTKVNSEYISSGFLYSKVTFIDDTIIAGKTLKRITTEILPFEVFEDYSVIYFSNTFIEEIGGLGYPVPWITSASYDGEYPSGLNCYEHQDLGLVKFTENDCDYLPVDIINMHAHFSELFPNPTNSIIYLHINSIEQAFLIISDIHGVKINRFFQKENNDLYSTDISNLVSGIYFATIFVDNKIIGTQKILKQ